MVIFQGIFFLLLGTGLLAIDYFALHNGWLPCGSNGVRKLVFRKNEQPFGFWFMFIVYGAAGISLVIFSLRLLAGYAEPLPL